MSTLPIDANYRAERYVRWIAVAIYVLQHCETGGTSTGFSEDASNQAVLCSKKSLHGFPSESVPNPSYSEVHMAQATSLQPGQIRHLLRVTAATSRHPERDTLVLLLGLTAGMRVTEIAQIEVQATQRPSTQSSNT